MTRFAKKSLLLLLVVLLVAAFACSCGGEKNPAETTDPTVTDPVVTDPVVTDPVVTDPVVTDPVVTDPVVTDPVIVPEKPETINYADYYPLYVQDGLLYHMNFASAVESDKTIGGVSAYVPFTVQVRDGIPRVWWDGFQSTLGNGYLKLVGGANIFGGTELKDILKSAKAYSVEIVASLDAGSRMACYVGPGFDLGVGTNFSAGFNIGAWDKMAKNPAALAEGETVDYNINTIAVKTAADGTLVNTYAFAFDLSKMAETRKYDFNVYANGEFCAERLNILAETNEFSALGSLAHRSGNARVYAVRVYDRQLSAEEVSLNHFIDIAMLNGFDLTEFNALDDAKKASVCKAMEFYAADEDYTYLAEAFADAMADAK